MKTNPNLPSDRRVSGRSKKMGLSAKPEFCEKLRTLSFKERRLQIEILEEALELYEKKQKTKQHSINFYQLLGVNDSQEIKTLLAQRTLPQLVSRINSLIKQLKSYQQTIQTIEQQMKTFQGTMNWEELKAKTNNLNPTYFNKINLTITYQILKETLEEFLRMASEKNNSGISKT